MKKTVATSAPKAAGNSKNQRVSYDERKAKIQAITKRLGEAYPMAGNNSGEEMLWQSLTSQTAAKDLNSITQQRMQQIAFYLNDTNPIAHRIIEIITNFVVGDGFTYTADNAKVQEVLEQFWMDSDNNLDMAISDNVSELSLYGENCFPVWVNPVDGSVKLSYLDPSNIVKITKNKKNPRWSDTVIWKARYAAKENILKIIQVDRNSRSKTYGKLVGDAFYFAINKPISATRGRSDLLSLADWIDGYDQFLFARLERAFLLNTFIWDITAEGLNKEELEEFVKGIPIPKPGSIRAHNEKITWEAISPKLEAGDASGEARLFRNQILGGIGFPEHWFAEGSGTTRATAMEMGVPTIKKLTARQKVVKYQYTFMCQFAIDQAVIAGTLSEKEDKTFKVNAPSIFTKDTKGMADSLDKVADSLIKAVKAKWIDNNEAANTFKLLVNHAGVDEMSSDTGAIEDQMPDDVGGTPGQQTDPNQVDPNKKAKAAKTEQKPPQSKKK